MQAKARYDPRPHPVSPCGPVTNIPSRYLFKAFRLVGKTSEFVRVLADTPVTAIPFFFVPWVVELQ